MKKLLSTICLLAFLAACGCSDPQPVNVAEDADAAKIEEYNRLNQQGQADLSADEENQETP
ncbi:secreted protein [Rhodopirellula sallentina]|uniref:Secreted protein n=1 Tax=Rhodopirellula sallentina SM41 TaxID=1263870 RepID=M5TZF9_9BACT|nr:secreted protein [Rhodopirellula sallentina]EMI54592.1 secreted protein [Rhodopirellula sallentina SM41]